MRSVIRIAALVIGLAGAALPAAAQNDSLVTAIKAAYLYKFAPFITWPASVFPSPSSPLNLCVAGSDPFGGTLERAVAGQKLADHPLIVRHLAAAARSDSCQILFLGGSDSEALARGLQAVRGAPMLTVTDVTAGASVKGVVDFVVADNRVRFEIDPAAAAANGLAISSKLIRLAVNVRP